LKILFFNWRDITHPQAGGCELHLQEIAKRLVAAGHEVTLFCGTYPGCKDGQRIDGIEVVRGGGAFGVYPAAFVKYISSLRKRRFDVVVDDINGVPFFTPLYVGRPRVAVLHHMVKEIFFRELGRPFGLVGYTAERMIPFLYGRTTFVTVSESSRREMVEAGLPEKNISIVHNGIAPMFGPGDGKKNPAPCMVYLGRLKAYKRLDRLILAMKEVRREIPDAELLIAGSGDVEDELKRQSKELGLGSAVKFHGFIDEREKLRLLRSAWLFVTPSQKEGWGLTVIEANACGTPAIAYDVPGLRDSIRDGYNGILVKKYDEASLARAIIRLLKDDDRRAELCRAALSWAERFSWDKSAEKFERILRSTMG